MKKIVFFLLPIILLFLTCETAVKPEKADRQNSVDEDELIARYSTQLIANPRTQDEIDQNVILNFLIDSLWDFQKTPSGIFYQIEKAGEGKSPNLQSQVIAHYRGTLLNGKEFDSSIKKGTPLMFSLNGVIQGWQEALPMLKVGGKGAFLIPSRLAYGKTGLPGLIDPNSVLMFEIELINVR